MEVEKIEINRKLMDIEYPNYKEAVVPPLSAMILDDNELPPAEYTTINEINYEVREVYDGKERRKLLVKVDDFGIFDDLLMIGSEDIQRQIQEKIYKEISFIELKFKSKINNEKKRLANNPLWRRVFKKYK